MPMVELVRRVSIRVECTLSRCSLSEDEIGEYGAASALLQGWGGDLPDGGKIVVGTSQNDLEDLDKPRDISNIRPVTSICKHRKILKRFLFGYHFDPTSWA